MNEISNKKLNKKRHFPVYLKTVIALTLSISGSHLYASELVYVPTNPSFGGNPSNGAYLLNNAQASNSHKAPGNSFGSNQQSALDRFANNLQSQLLNDVLSNALNNTDDSNQTLTTDGFQVTLNRNSSGLTVNIVDTNTGEQSTIVLAN